MTFSYFFEDTKQKPLLRAAFVGDYYEKV